MFRIIIISVFFTLYYPLYAESIFIRGHSDYFIEWNQEDHQNNFHSMQAVAKRWEERPFLVYGRHDPFCWEMIPFQPTNNPLSRYWQQFAVGFRLIFKKTTNNAKGQNPEIVKQSRSITTETSDDPFCNPDIIKRQQVLEGNLISVLYNYKPLGKDHFLFIPKKHKRDFRELSEDEYIEAMKLSQFVIRRLEQTQPIHNIYLFHKTGVDAGQTVPHWHLHLIVTENTLFDWIDKIKWLWKITYGTEPLKPAMITQKVEHFKKILN